MRTVDDDWSRIEAALATRFVRFGDVDWESDDMDETGGTCQFPHLPEPEPERGRARLSPSLWGMVLLALAMWGLWIWDVWNHRQ